MSPVDVPIADINVSGDRLRALRPEKIDELAESIAESGLLQPIVVAHDGRLIAGWHRLEAAKRLGWKSIRAQRANRLDADAIKLAEIDENLARAELSPAERAIHVAARKALYEKRHPETQHGAIGKGRRKVCDSTRFTTDTAKKTGSSERSVQLDAQRAKSIPRIRDVIGTSLDEGVEIDALAKLPAGEQGKLIDRAKAGEKVSAKGAAKKVIRERRELKLAEATHAASKALGKKLYSVIYADPATRFEPWSRETGMDRAADNHYPTMITDKICAMQVPAADDSILFLWATVPMLEHSLRIMREWGFDYRSMITWDKEREATGYWARNRTEHLLIGVRGKVPAPAPGDQPPGLVRAPATEHSCKPVAFAEIIERSFPNQPKLEMFARRRRPGWDVHGNEVEQVP